MSKVDKSPTPTATDTTPAVVIPQDQEQAPSQNRRYSMAAIEQMLTVAGYEISKVNKRYLIKKDGKEFHPTPDGFQWYEAYRFCTEVVLGKAPASGGSAPVSRKMFSKRDQAFLLRFNFFVIKDNDGFLFIHDSGIYWQDWLPNEQCISLFMVSTKEEAAGFSRDLQELCVIPNREQYPLISNPLSFSDYLRKLAKAHPEAAELVDSLLGFEYKPLFKVNDTSRKLVSSLSLFRGGRNFKLIKSRFMHLANMSSVEVEQLILDGFLIQSGKFVTLGAIA